VTGGHVLALSGGVGGAKLCSGLADVLSPERLTMAVNTGDDFEHLGLTICPDIDSVVYALSSLNDTTRGWGVKDETWQAMAMLRALGAEDWFNLGDRDLGTHLARSARLRGGESLSQATAALARQLGIVHAIVPMSDAPVRTQVETDAGWLDFQHWFVREQCRPAVRAIRFAGLPADPSVGLQTALSRADLGAIVICPSNPFVSVDPILSLNGVRDALMRRRVPVVAVSPLVGGQAVKGPLAKMLAELGHACNNLSIARHYLGLVDHWLIDLADAEDAHEMRALGVAVSVTATVMCSADDRRRLAREALSSAGLPAG
jgi:LPPG:FO 2-phospho-L-lactate transferase